MKDKLLSGVILLYFLLLSVNLSGQFESAYCKCCNPELKELFTRKTLDVIYLQFCHGNGFENLASSFLLPEGPAPEIIPAPDSIGPPDDAAFTKWTCRYSAGKVTDNDPKTAWVEGEDGQGIGEALIVPCLDLNKPVRIWAGYGKSNELYMANSRPKKIRIVIISGEWQGAAQNGIYYENLRIIAEKVITLSDLNGYQDLPLPPFKTSTYHSKVFNDEKEYNYFLGLEILSVYPGSKYSDTCISEIANKQ